MPNTNLPAGAPGEEQTQDGMFRWVEETRKKSILRSRNGDTCGVVERIDVRWIAGVYLSEEYLDTGIYGTEEAARRSVEVFWQTAAQIAKALGLCEPKSALVACFAVQDAAGHDHVYETPEVACRFRIASDGSLRDVVDMDGNPVTIRKAELS